MADPAEVYEHQNVHEVYQQIAGHFSATRYKVCYSCSIAWPAQLTHLSQPAMAHRGEVPQGIACRICRVRCGLRKWQESYG